MYGSAGSFSVIESASETMVINGGSEDVARTSISPVAAVKRTISSEDIEISDGKREESLSLAGFDILRFKNNFLEVIKKCNNL